MSMPYLHQLVISGQTRALKEQLMIHDNPNLLEPEMGNAPLHLAVQRDDLEMLEALLNAGAFINLQTPRHGVTALMIAVWHRQVDVVAFLLKQPGINIEIVSTFGLKAEELIDFGADQDDATGLEQRNQMQAMFYRYRLQLEDHQQEMLAYQLVTASELNDQEKAERLRMLAPDKAGINLTSPVNSSGNDEHTALLVAARDGLVKSLQVLLELGADQSIPDHYMKAIALHKAAYNGHADVIEILSNYPGFDVCLNAQGPNNGYTPLHDAVWHGHVEAARLLVAKGARTDLAGFDGRTPLDLAIDYDYNELVALLEPC